MIGSGRRKVGGDMRRKEDVKGGVRRKEEVREERNT